MSSNANIDFITQLCLQEVAVKNTPLFLRYLTDQMHEKVRGSLVLWYDSVIENGQLQWQNEVNQSNRWKKGYMFMKI